MERDRLPQTEKTNSEKNRLILYKGPFETTMPFHFIKEVVMSRNVRSKGGGSGCPHPSWAVIIEGGGVVTIQAETAPLRGGVRVGDLSSPPGASSRLATVFSVCNFRGG